MNVLLLGPRQVGKSSLMRLLKPQLYLDLANESLFLSYSKDPSRFVREVRAQLTENRRLLIVVDEIQRVPALLNTIQSVIDEHRQKVRILITGSSARKLKRGHANLLPGRIILETLDPLMISEVGEGFDLERGLQLGMLPGIYGGREEAIEILSSYVEVYLKEEIQAEALARDIGSYARFLDMMAVMSGRWLNYSKVGSDTEINKETIRRYVSVLEDTLVGFRLPAFQPVAQVKRKVSQRDRIFFFDLGVRNALLQIHRKGLGLDQRGAAFEHWFILQVLYLSRHLKRGWRLSSYRTDAGAEVDLVVEREKDIVAIEIKASRNIGKSDLRGLRSFSEILSAKKLKVLRKRIAYLGDQSQKFEDATIAMPYRRLIESLEDE